MIQVPRLDRKDKVPGIQATGSVVAVRGTTIVAKIPFIQLGALCSIRTLSGTEIPCQVVSFNGEETILSPFTTINGIHPGSSVRTSTRPPSCLLSDNLLGKVCDAFGNPMESPPLGKTRGIACKLFNDPPSPLKRLPISSRFETGVAVLDSLCTLGIGQRVGLFAGPGVGKSTLLGMIARNSNAEINIIALVGERGREVLDFVQHCLGSKGMARSIVLVATSDQPAAQRMLAAYTAQAFAEHYRQRGKKVLLLVDSLTRMARAIREVSLSAGEIPVREGYTPSVYAELPKLLERAGNDDRGSITAIYTILTAADGYFDALSEEVKSILDGHIVLSQTLCDRGIRPAVDPLQSVSRLFENLHSESYRADALTIRQALAQLKTGKEAMAFGAEPDTDLKQALAVEKELFQFLTQTSLEVRGTEESMRTLQALASALRSS